MKLKLLLFSAVLCTTISWGQTLAIPNRSATALEGSQVVSAISSLALQDREIFIRNEVMTGNVPMFYRDMILVKDSALISGSYVQVEYYVIPDYLALGSETDYFLCPMTPILAQQLADSTNCILPTRKMVDQIWSAATVKMNPESIPPSPAMTTVPVFDTHNGMVWTQRQTFLPTDSLGVLVAGNKKDVVISNLIYTLPPPERVIIYGWHYPSGTNIQPMYGGHISTYADYSHGIRLVQNQIWVDGVPMLASSVLSSSTLHPLLSDEGALAQPYYPDTSGTIVPNPPSTPISFAVTNENANSIRVSVKFDANVDDYLAYTSSDGVNFSSPVTFNSNDFVISGLTTNQITYVKLAASNVDGLSNQSEVLAAVPSANQDSVLIVNAFDRNSTGNTKNFVIQHGEAIMNYGAHFSSSTNEGIVDQIVVLNDYQIVDYIIGEESTVDETFDDNEQNLVSDFLEQGGFLFVSGAEIGWDLDHLGSVSDQQFYADYLHAQYVFDSPDDVSSTHYEFEATDSVFNGIGNVFFDDGTNGTYNVDYPDVINAVNGATNGLSYSNLTNNNAGIYYHGPFGGSTISGKVVYFGFPFETIYPSSNRNEVMAKVMEYFYYEPSIDTSTNDLDIQVLPTISIYPNPFNDQLIIHHSFDGDVFVKIYGLNGQLMGQFLSSEKSIQMNTTSFSAGIYWLEIQHSTGMETRKIIKN